MCCVYLANVEFMRNEIIKEETIKFSLRDDIILLSIIYRRQ